jgi:hypothetical protein
MFAFLAFNPRFLMRSNPHVCCQNVRIVTAKIVTLLALVTCVIIDTRYLMQLAKLVHMDAVLALEIRSFAQHVNLGSFFILIQQTLRSIVSSVPQDV